MKRNKILALFISIIMCFSLLVSCGETPEDIPDEGVKKGDTLYFGEYPQTVKAADVTVTEAQDERGYFLGSDGAYYARLVAVNGCGLSSGKVIKAGDVEYFKVEPIKWRVLRIYEGTAILLSDVILTNMVYSLEGINNYEKSDVRAWLNGDFYNTAFGNTEKDNIIVSGVDNSAVTTINNRNDFACRDTQDNVYLLSYSDFIKEDYGFHITQNRKMLTTDYAKANGASSTWLTRSPDSSFRDNVHCITYAGNIRTKSVTDATNGVVPVISINLQ